MVKKGRRVVYETRDFSVLRDNGISCYIILPKGGNQCGKVIAYRINSKGLALVLKRCNYLQRQKDEKTSRP